MECIENIAKVLGYETLEELDCEKNKKYHIEHANSLNYNAMKNHYLLTQLADILRQLYKKGVNKIRDLNKSIKEISSSLLESFQTRLLTNGKYLYML